MIKAGTLNRYPSAETKPLPADPYLSRSGLFGPGQAQPEHTVFELSFDCFLVDGFRQGKFTKISAYLELYEDVRLIGSLPWREKGKIENDGIQSTFRVLSIPI
jgi:hypothetical protein